MDYLSRESAPFSPELWEKIDSTVVEAARRILVGRKFLTLFGPLGAGVRTLNIDGADRTEKMADGVVTTTDRKYFEVPQLYADFNLFWRDIEESGRENYPLDLSPVTAAAETAARLEDKLVFFGNKELGVPGLLTADGIAKIKRSDWAVGENAHSDIEKGLVALNTNGYYGRYALILSPDLYLELQRIQPGTGVMEIDRISKIVEGRVYYATALGTKRAALVCCEPQNMDLAVGQDLAAAYLELVDLNHHMRVLETVLPRVKRPGAVVAYE